MPITHDVWRINDKAQTGSGLAPLKSIRLHNEKELEDLIVAAPEVLDDGWLLVGRQIRTDLGKVLDLLAIDAGGSLIVIELKVERTPREVVAQVIEYASWVRKLGFSDLEKYYAELVGKPDAQLIAALEEKFGTRSEEAQLNGSQQLIIVATEVDPSTEAILEFLERFEVPINILTFAVFEEDGRRYVSRAWMRDPSEIQVEAEPNAGPKEPWNGEYYASLGADDADLNWDDARKYGFIAASGGRWYTQTLKMLSKGDRVWVNIPKEGYVGVGVVEQEAVGLESFHPTGTDDTLRTLKTKGDYSSPKLTEPGTEALYVKITWKTTVDRQSAFRMPGYFGNQNTVSRPRAGRWRATVQALRKHWSIQD